MGTATIPASGTALSASTGRTPSRRAFPTPSFSYSKLNRTPTTALLSSPLFPHRNRRAFTTLMTPVTLLLAVTHTVSSSTLQFDSPSSTEATTAYKITLAATEPAGKLLRTNRPVAVIVDPEPFVHDIPEDAIIVITLARSYLRMSEIVDRLGPASALVTRSPYATPGRYIWYAANEPESHLSHYEYTDCLMEEFLRIIGTQNLTAHIIEDPSHNNEWHDAGVGTFSYVFQGILCVCAILSAAAGVYTWIKLVYSGRHHEIPVLSILVSLAFANLFSLVFSIDPMGMRGNLSFTVATVLATAPIPFIIASCVFFFRTWEHVSGYDDVSEYHSLWSSVGLFSVAFSFALEFAHIFFRLFAPRAIVSLLFSTAYAFFFLACAAVSVRNVYLLRVDWVGFSSRISLGMLCRSLGFAGFGCFLLASTNSVFTVYYYALSPIGHFLYWIVVYVGYSFISIAQYYFLLNMAMVRPCSYSFVAYLFL
eukprot:TRINITY_DN290_c0_g1_i5.p1 TRINITY_DN290_c0_g1~~TRINITY_DN290_c0_g1_i5.p1  ORF type:complete len:480 (+),score=21.44 TRINITY_DN290_c0_g1_i5:223-1662(+)